MDHHPLLLSLLLDMDRINKPFQFFKFTTNITGFQEVVLRAWNSSFVGDPMSVLCKKLNREIRVN